MHDEELRERFGCEIERYLGALIDNHAQGKIIVTTRIFCGPISIKDVQKVARLVRAADHAKALHARHGPAWAQPLPLGEIERIKLCLQETNLPLHFVAYYSFSLQGRDYDYLSHPQLFDYCRALMADPRIPQYLREDPALRAEFPPKPIAGLDDQGRWRPLPNRASQIIEAPISSGLLDPRYFSAYLRV
jgi:hypothetical protein